MFGYFKVVLKNGLLVFTLIPIISMVEIVVRLKGLHSWIFTSPIGLAVHTE